MIDEKDLFERAAQRFDPPTDALERLLDRRQRRARARRTSVIAVALILAVATFGMVVATFGGHERRKPITTPIPIPFAPEGFRSAVLPFASIAYPSGWRLLDTSGEGQTDEGPVLQLTNFDAGVALIDCGSAGVPADGVALVVSEQGRAAADASPWPVQLTDAGAAAGCPGAMHVAWAAPNGVAYAADAFVGEQASRADRDALTTAFGSLLFPSDLEPQVVVFPGGPRVVLDTGMSGGDPVTLYAFLDESGLNLSVAGPVHSANPDTPSIYLSATGVDTGGRSDAFVDVGLDGPNVPFSLAFGTVKPEVDHVELVTDLGDRFPARIVPFPASLGRTDRAVWGFMQGPTSGVVPIAFDAQGKELGTNWYTTAPPDTLASGEDLAAGAWELSVTHSNLGDGLGLAWGGQGTSGGCCFSDYADPATHALWTVGTEISTTRGEVDRVWILAIANDRAEEVVFESAGQIVSGTVAALPPRYMGPAKVALVIVPTSLVSHENLVGNLVAYDAQGAEVGRLFLGAGKQPPVPTPETGAVWESLARASDAISTYGAEHPLTELDASTLSGLEPYVQWNLGAVVIPGQVTVGMESTSPDIGGDVLLRASTASGATYCIAVLIDEKAAPDSWGGTGTYHPVDTRYGHGDATSVAGCRGGWD